MKKILKNNYIKMLIILFSFTILSALYGLLNTRDPIDKLYNDSTEEKLFYTERKSNEIKQLSNEIDDLEEKIESFKDEKDKLYLFDFAKKDQYRKEVKIIFDLSSIPVDVENKDLIIFDTLKEKYIKIFHNTSSDKTKLLEKKQYLDSSIQQYVLDDVYHLLNLDEANFLIDNKSEISEFVVYLYGNSKKQIEERTNKLITYLQTNLNDPFFDFWNIEIKYDIGGAIKGKFVTVEMVESIVDAQLIEAVDYLEELLLVRDLKVNAFLKNEKEAFKENDSDFKIHSIVKFAGIGFLIGICIVSIWFVYIGNKRLKKSDIEWFESVTGFVLLNKYINNFRDANDNENELKIFDKIAEKIITIYNDTYSHNLLLITNSDLLIHEREEINSRFLKKNLHIQICENENRTINIRDNVDGIIIYANSLSTENIEHVIKIAKEASLINNTVLKLIYVKDLDNHLISI